MGEPPYCRPGAAAGTPGAAELRGDKIPVFNSSHDLTKKRYTMLDYIKAFPHFDEQNYDYLTLRTVSLLMQQARSGKSAEQVALNKELKYLRRVYLYYGTFADPIFDDSTLIPTGTVDWLETQMAPEDKDLFPVTFTDRMDFDKTVRAGHDYTWAHVIGGQRAQQNVIQRDAKAKAKL